MLLEQQRQAVVDTCRMMQEQGLVVGTAGNVSIRVDDMVVISPSAVPYENLTAADVGVHDMDGKAIEARYKPSSELPLHLSVYRASDADAITHNHAPASTALGLVVDEIPWSHYFLECSVARSGLPLTPSSEPMNSPAMLPRHLTAVLRP